MELKDIYEKIGLFYLGKQKDLKDEGLEDLFLLKSNNLTTHAAIIGMTGSGKTGLGISLIEEAVLDGIPSIVIDPKGDMGNLLLAFPDFKPEDFLPWIDKSEAKRKGISPEELAEKTAAKWKKGIESFGQSAERVKRFKNGADFTIYTPGSTSGIPLNVLGSFKAPGKDVIEDTDSFAYLIDSTVSSVLSLIGEDADPLSSKPYVFLSAILKHFWKREVSLTFEEIIGSVANPPFDRIGVLPLKTFFPQNERLKLAMKLNNIIASPSFESWVKGEELNISSLLYTKEGKPKVSIISIAHLSDRERMFFVTLLLNRIVGWMRGLKGTPSLKALLYMDEIFGYFPATSSPPSKKPMLILLKQARAYGLGVVLSTQNPVDLDYKGLSNIGSWFVGRLQTKQDIERVIDGFIKAGDNAFDKKTVHSLLASMPKRTFLLKSAHIEEPVLFGTRWVLSYLAGPLSSEQIKVLMKDKKQKTELSDEQPKPAEKKTVEKGKVKPYVPEGIKEFFHNLTAENCIYLPHLIAKGEVRFYNASRGIDIRKNVCLALPLKKDLDKAEWEKANPFDFDLDSYDKSPVSGCNFAQLPSFISSMKSSSSLAKSFKDFLYRNSKLTLYRVKKLRLESTPGEDLESFRERVASVLREKRDEEVEKLTAKFDKKRKSLEEKLDRAYARLEKEKADVSSKTTNTFLSFGMTVLDAFLGRKRVKRGTISKAGRAIKDASRLSKEKMDVRHAEERVRQLEDELRKLDADFEKEMELIAEKYSPSNFPVEEFYITPRRSDFSDIDVFILWENGMLSDYSSQ